MAITRRNAIRAGAATALCCALPSLAQADVRAYGQLKALAAQLAKEPFGKDASKLPETLLKLSYDQYRSIRFRPDRNIQLGHSQFYIQMFHPGFLFRQSVDLNLLSDAGSRRLRYSPSYFDFGRDALGNLPSNLGFAGFKVLYPLHRTDKLDEIISFLGASYFRFLGREQRYGLSARGLAIGSGDPERPEEFPRFREFWIVEPEEDARGIQILALLDSPSVAGAYEFTITPGRQTTVDVVQELFAREAMRPGIAPLTSMFLHRQRDRRPADDFRPNVHDSDTLLIGAAESWTSCPLINPSKNGITPFSIDRLEAFGLLQRERNFFAYQDLEANYHLRPSYWVQPLSDWGPGAVKLVELALASEGGDNVVAFWEPADLLRPGRSQEWSYRLTATADEGHLHSLAWAQSVRCGSRSHTLAEIIEVDFVGGELPRYINAPQLIELTAQSKGVAVQSYELLRNPHTGGLRARVTILPRHGSDCRLNLELRQTRQKISESVIVRV
ncbi:MAG: glucan biosynthesis protein G [Methylocystis sp.]|nr:glucan biosynthesis protein G [Methylocystis sp.]